MHSAQQEILVSEVSDQLAENCANFLDTAVRTAALWSPAYADRFVSLLACLLPIPDNQLTIIALSNRPIAHFHYLATVKLLVAVTQRLRVRHSRIWVSICSLFTNQYLRANRMHNISKQFLASCAFASSFLCIGNTI